jgi:hypothetical protein
MAESEGFEPSMEFLPYALSRGAPSATRPTLRNSVLLAPSVNGPSGHAGARVYSGLRPSPLRGQLHLRLRCSAQLAAACQPLGQLSVILYCLLPRSMALRAMQGRAYIRDSVPHPFGASFTFGSAVLRSLQLLVSHLANSPLFGFLESRIMKNRRSYLTLVRFNGCGLSH